MDLGIEKKFHFWSEKNLVTFTSFDILQKNGRFSLTANTTTTTICVFVQATD